MNLNEKADDMCVGFFSLRGAPVRLRRAGSETNPGSKKRRQRRLFFEVH